MVYFFVLLAGFLGVGLYLTVMYSSIPGAVDERLGTLEALPANLGVWERDESSAEATAAANEGLVREVRYLREPAKFLFGKEKLVMQVRYRHLHNNKIARIEPETRVPRRRKKIKAM